MKLTIPSDVLKKALSAGNIKSAALIEARMWHNEETIESNDVPREDLEILLEAAAGTAKVRGARKLERKLRTLLRVIDGDVKKTKLLDVLAEMMRQRIKSTKHNWVFVEHKPSGELLPYNVDSIYYTPASGKGYNYVPAHVTLNTTAIRRGGRTQYNKTIERNSLNNEGVDADGGFIAMGTTIENNELVTEYEESLKAYENVAHLEGAQYNAVGQGVIVSEDRWWRDESSIELGNDEQPGRVIVNDWDDWNDDSGTTIIESRGFSINNDTEADDEDANYDTVALPRHPIVRVFDLKRHVFCYAHVNCLSEYVYQPELYDKLIMPEETKQLIEVLVLSATKGKDIIGTKGSGAIILTSGPPGTGKTLTAEIFSERAKAPLYAVQCSQLGTNADALEEKLAEVLHRAARWNAILLIDEADVFVYERGSDIAQNAVVGIFLRLLEYYPGVLFLTTNRESKVDDAIKSRCVAHVRYCNPDDEDRERLWDLFFTQFELDAPRKIIPTLVSKFSNVSGRSIRGMCRMAKTVEDASSSPADAHTFDWIAQFLDLEQKHTESVKLGRPLKAKRTRSRVRVRL